MKGPAFGLRAACAVALWTVLASCEATPPPSGITPHAVASSAGSRTPHLFTFHDTTYLSWVQPAGDSALGLYYCAWNGTAWGRPLPVAQGRHWVVSWADVPKVLVDETGLTAVWLEPIGPDGSGYGVKYLRRARGAPTQTPPAWLHADTSSCEHGFTSLVPLDSGGVLAMWLDGRETPAGGPTTLRSARLDLQGPPRDETLLDLRVCDCCPTAAVRCNDGSILVAYRDRSPEEVRDIAVTRFESGRWSTPRTVYRDEWKIDGCPVNGPALAVSDSLVALAWFTMSGGVDPTVNVAFSRDCGRRFGAPVRVDRRHPEGRIDLTWLPDGTLAVVWVEAYDSTATLWARRVSPAGGADPAIAVTDRAGDRTSGFPSVACAGERILVAWTETTDSTRVRTAELQF